MNDAIPAILAGIKADMHALYEEAPCGYLFTLPDGTIVDLNQTLSGWLGYSERALMPHKRFQDLLTVGGKLYYETSYAPLLRLRGRVAEIALDLAGSDGRIIPTLVHSELILDAEGNALLVRSTLFNVTERRKYERELLDERRRAEHSERRFKLLASAGETLRRSFDHVSNLRTVAELATQEYCDACTIDLLENGRLVRVAAIHRVPGRELPAFGEEAWRQLSRASFITSDANTDAATLEATFPWARDALTALCPDSLMLAPLLRDGAAVGLIGFYLTELGLRFQPEDLELAREIASRCATAVESSRLNAEKEHVRRALVESHEWFSTTLRCIGDAIITIDTSQTVTFLNPVAEELTGYSLAEARGRPMSEVFHIVHEHTGEAAFNPVETVLRERIVVGLANHTALIRRDGVRRIIEDSAAPILSGSGELFGVVLVFRDTTEKYLKEKALKDTLAELREERQVREKFVAMLTHDLRSPLTAAKMGAQFILRQPALEVRVGTHAARLLKSINRADQMIQDLLDVNRIRAGEILPLEMGRCDLAGELREAIKELSLVHGERFRVDAPSELIGSWNCGSLRRVIENLCNNAVKYGVEGAPVDVTLEARAGQAVLSVHNQGEPIPVEEQATLFEPYRRAESAKTSGKRGWGLGLTLVRGVAEAHGGSISLRSVAGEGTTFTFGIPFVPSGQTKIAESVV